MSDKMRKLERIIVEADPDVAQVVAEDLAALTEYADFEVFDEETGDRSEQASEDARQLVRSIADALMDGDREDTARLNEVYGFVLSALEAEIEANHDQCADTGEETFAEFIEIQRNHNLLLELSDGEKYRVTIGRSEQ